MAPDPFSFRYSSCLIPSLTDSLALYSLHDDIMGVPKLWEVLKPSAKIQDLNTICYERGFDANGMPMILGIDVSIWFNEVCAVYRKHHAQAGENPELRLIFYRLAQLACYFVSPVFVFDGPSRPTIKRGVNVLPAEHFLVRKTKTLVEAFGFNWHQAPGEAEAELARMNQENVIDAVLTEDVDVLVFGASTVIQVSQFTGHCMAKIYTMEDINATLSMSHSNLIFVALLSGGDYNRGISGCGMDSACALARCGFGTSLLTAKRRQPPREFFRFLDDWRADLKHQLNTNESGYLSSKKPNLSKRITSQFPDLSIAELYLNPSTSWSRKGCITPSREMFFRGRLDLAALSRLCEENFAFGTAYSLLKKFKSILSLGIMMDLVIQHIGLGTVAPNRVLAAITSHRLLHGLPEYRIKVDLSALIPVILRGLTGSREEVPPLNSFDPKGSVRYHWIAGDILFRAFPDMVEHYHTHVKIPNPFNIRAGLVMHIRRDIIDLTSDFDDIASDDGDEGNFSGDEMERMVANAKAAKAQEKREIIDLTL